MAFSKAENTLTTQLQKAHSYTLAQLLQTKSSIKLSQNLQLQMEEPSQIYGAFQLSNLQRKRGGEGRGTKKPYSTALPKHHIPRTTSFTEGSLPSVPPCHCVQQLYFHTV